MSNRKLWEALDIFEAAHQKLTLAVDDVVPAEKALYTNYSTAVYDLVPGSYVDRFVFNQTTRMVNLANLGEYRRIMCWSGCAHCITRY